MYSAAAEADMTDSTDESEAVMANTAMVTKRRTSAGVSRLVRRLERERRAWTAPDGPEIPTAQAWRAGVAEGIRLAQLAIRKGV
jgi:hypothetical protein